MTGAPAAVSFTFTGRKVRLFAQRGPAAGKVDGIVVIGSAGGGSPPATGRASRGLR